MSNDSSEPVAADRRRPSAATRRRQWWPAAGILGLGAATIAWARLTDWFSTAAHQFVAAAAAAILTTAALAVWFVFFTGLSRRIQVALVSGGIAALVGVGLLARVEGVSGDFVPHLAWRWAARPDETLVRQPIDVGVAAAAEVDLTATSADDFPQFLGPERRAVVHGMKLARDWTARPPRRLWRQPIGAGWSALAVVGRFAVTQEQRGELETVVCYELSSGKVCWMHADRGRFSAVIAGDGPRATPTVDHGRVYALGATGRLNCLDGATGMRLWSRDVVQENDADVPAWGKSCSPLIVDDLVVVAAGGTDHRSLVAYHKVTGVPVWAAGSGLSSYASPVLATLAGVRQILVVNAGSVTAHDPARQGSVLWEYPWEGGEPKVPQPVPVGADRLLIAAGYGLGCKLLEIKTGREGALGAEEVWSSRALKPKFTNVVVRDGFVYGLDDGRSLVCLDLATGERKWRGGRYGHGQLLLVEELFLVQAESGEVVLVEATGAGQHELGRFQALDGKTWNNPALSGPFLLVRNAEEAACYELPLE